MCLFWEVWGCLIGRCTAAWRLGEEVQDGRRALGRALKEVAGRGEADGMFQVVLQRMTLLFSACFPSAEG